MTNKKQLDTREDTGDTGAGSKIDYRMATESSLREDQLSPREVAKLLKQHDARHLSTVADIHKEMQQNKNNKTAAQQMAARNSASFGQGGGEGYAAENGVKKHPLPLGMMDDPKVSRVASENNSNANQENRNELQNRPENRPQHRLALSSTPRLKPN